MFFSDTLNFRTTTWRDLLKCVHSLDFPFHSPSRQLHQDSFRVRFLFAVYIAWPQLLVAQSSSVGKTGCAGPCSLSVVEYGYTASPGMSRRSRNVSPAMSRKSSVVSWSDSPREHSEANGEDTVMEDGTETHQAEINKKIKANDKLRNILTNMPEEHRTLIYGDSIKSKMDSLDDEKATLAGSQKAIPTPAKSDRQTEKLSGARFERDRIETEEASGNPVNMDRGRSGTGSSQR